MDWIHNNGGLLSWIGALALTLSLLSPFVIVYFIEKLPADYFVQPHRPLRSRLHPLGILKNLIGLFLALAGIAMLVLPGQGILTIMVGLALMDFPGKKKMELALLRLPKVTEAVSWIRKKGGKVPFQLNHRKN